TTMTFLGLVTMLAACAAPSEDEQDPDLAVADTRAAELRISPGGSKVKSKSELEADGYVCRNWGGTTVTECTKFGEPTYTCDSAGRCTVLRVVTPTVPIVVAPAPTVLAP